VSRGGTTSDLRNPSSRHWDGERIIEAIWCLEELPDMSALLRFKGGSANEESAIDVMTGPEYELFAIRYATREARRSDHFIGGDPHDGPMPMDYFM
jgi:hypothetical protein